MRAPPVAAAPEPGPSAPGPERLAAGIVAFGPSPERLPILLDALGPPVERVFVFVNGLIDEGLRAEIARTRPTVEFVEADLNFGVGAALNLTALAALLAGFDLLLLFDQDSRPRPGMAEALLCARGRCLAAGERPAVIAPRLVAPAAEPRCYKPPRYVPYRGRARVDGLTPVSFVPTSGSLLELAAFREIGSFRADYFIDAIDLEWCFRAWARGRSCWMADRVTMEHTIGEGVVEAPFGLRMPRQKAFRMAAYLRNTVYGFRLPHIPLGWKLKQAVYLPVQVLLVLAGGRFSREMRRDLLGGLRDGLRGRLGPPAGAALTGPAWDPRGGEPGDRA